MASPEDSSSLVGAKVVIPCQAVGDPEPVISWMFNEKEINTESSGDGDDRKKYTQLPSGALRIESLSPLDSGDYRCKATNMIGEAMSRPARMTVEDRSVAGTDHGAALPPSSGTTRSPATAAVRTSGPQLHLDHVPEDVTIPLNDSIILHCAEPGTSRTDWRPSCGKGAQIRLQIN